MADNQIDIGEQELTAEDAVKQRLLGRIAVAGVIIVGLLGSLAMFDAIYAPRPQAPAPVATVTPPPVTTPPPEAPATEVPPAATPSVAEVPPGSATPEKTVAAPAEPLPPLPTERLTPPASAQKALAQPAPVVSVPQAGKPPVAAAPSGAPGTTTPLTPVAPVGKSPAPPSRPLSQPPAQHAAAAKPSGALTGLLPPDQPPRQFALQLGIFSNFVNAEELRAKLEAAGIPTTVEARVRAGPFATRGEADAARVKLRQMGIEESIMVSVKR
ncbi:MAG: SPOR domain-containing protein [Rhodocyclaceae bacterium]|jgi:cell division protein FtsN|nr:SPOR domain-containing protein [Rhodocyclaceae bacterium]